MGESIKKIRSRVLQGIDEVEELEPIGSNEAVDGNAGEEIPDKVEENPGEEEYQVVASDLVPEGSNLVVPEENPEASDTVVLLENENEKPRERKIPSFEPDEEIVEIGKPRENET